MGWIVPGEGEGDVEGNATTFTNFNTAQEFISSQFHAWESTELKVPCLLTVLLRYFTSVLLRY